MTVYPRFGMRHKKRPDAYASGLERTIMRNALTILFVFVALLVGGVARAYGDNAPCMAVVVDATGVNAVANETTSIYGDPAGDVDILYGNGIWLATMSRPYNPEKQQNLLITS